MINISCNCNNLTGKTPPSPDSILDIFNGSVANAPTISNSGLWGANPFGAIGYFWVIALLAAASL